jgi:hypothetical protein
MDNKYAYLGLGLAFVGGVALGAGAGYRYAQQKFSEEITEEIKKTKEFYSNLYKSEYPTPGDAADALIPDVKLDEATVALHKYQGVSIKPEDLEHQPDVMSMIVDDMRKSPEVEVEVEERNIFDNGDQLQIHKEERDTSKPYVVDLEEYMEHPEGHDEIQLTYYAGDGVLGDDEDQPIEDVDGIVGQMNLNMFGASDPDDPHILLVRNEQKKLDIEVTFSDGKFAHEVLGFEHSDEPMRRSRPRWDDE